MTVLQPLVLSSQSVCINLLHHMFVFVLVAGYPLWLETHGAIKSLGGEHHCAIEVELHC